MTLRKNMILIKEWLLASTIVVQMYFSTDTDAEEKAEVICDMNLQAHRLLYA